MSFISQLNEAIKPHAENLNKTILGAGAVITDRLQRIETSVSDLARPDVGDIMTTITRLKTITGSTPEELGVVPPNEIWLVQALCTDGIFNASPAYVIFKGAKDLVFSVVREGIGTESPGGDIILSRGEKLFVETRETGKVSFTLYIVRRRIPTAAMVLQTGPSSELLVGVNPHEVERDVIASSTGQYVERPGETDTIVAPEHQPGHLVRSS